MNDEQQDREEEIFHRALELAPGEERTAYLEEACGEDSDLRLGVEQLLEAHDKPASLLGDTENDLGSSNAGRAGGEQAGDRFGNRYELIEEIGKGGMGTVWLAEQSQPVRRKVALKIIKLGMDTREVVARFEAERQALAMMDHPGIAKIFDAGVTDSGRPFFVMELVEGQPLTRYCDERRLGTRQRLELFVEVCRAVQHAHQKGVVHRDIKPTNILVGEQDGRPGVKVIDFGVAKAVEEKLAGQTQMTVLGRVIGTLGYMSPEQAGGEKDIDTRSDIYSLGVVLYELLAGEPPFGSNRFREAAFDAALKMIREEEPPKPSTRMSHLGETSLGAARCRSTEIHKLARTLRGDLDWIVMRALEKDRDRRYETANGLAADIGRYLDEEPVHAIAPSAAYKFKKFAHRNKTAIGVAAATVVLLVGGIATTSWQAIRATAEKGKAEEATLTAQFNEGLGWLLRAEVAEKEGHRYPDSLLYAARAIGFDGVGRPGGELSHLPRLIRDDRDPDEYEKARRWIRERPHYLPVWSSDPPRNPSPITRLSVSPAGRWLAVRSEDGDVRLWDFSAADTNESEIASASGSPANDIVFHPDGKRLAVADAERLRFWDLEKETFTWEEHAGTFGVLACSPDGRFVAGAAADGSILVWGEGGEKEAIIKTGQSAPASGLTFSADGTVLAAVFRGVAVEMFFHEEAREDQRPLRSWEKWAERHPRESSELNNIAFSPDGLTLAVGSENGGVSLWDVSTARLLGEVERQERHKGGALDLSFGQDGKQLASASADCTLKLWKLEDNKLRITATLNGHRSEVTEVMYLPGVMLLASAGSDGGVRLWDVSGRAGEKPDLYNYQENEWYTVGTQQVDWAAGEGFLSLAPESVVGMWQRGEGASDGLFGRLLEGRNWGAAGLLVAIEDEGKRGVQLAEALLADAEAAAADGRWNMVRLRLRQRTQFGVDEVGAEKAAEITDRLPGKLGSDFEIEEGFEMVWCPRGSLNPEPFRMGDPPDQQEIRFESGFWIGKYEVTQSQFQTLMGERHGKGKIEGGDLPKVGPTRDEVGEFCRKLTSLARLRGGIPAGWEYALPTSAQWEYACRAGTTTAYSCGDEAQELDDYAWYESNSKNQTHAVGTKKPNPWGLHDMHGNVWEWCQTSDGSDLVARGGSFLNPATWCRSANIHLNHRYLLEPNFLSRNIGIRPVLVPARQSEPAR